MIPDVRSLKNDWRPIGLPIQMRRVRGVRFWTDSKDGFGLRRDESALSIRCSSHADVKIREFHLRAERIETTSLRTVMATL